MSLTLLNQWVSRYNQHYYACLKRKIGCGEAYADSCRQFRYKLEHNVDVITGVPLLGGARGRAEADTDHTEGTQMSMGVCVSFIT